jgi:hypothetical protein
MFQSENKMQAPKWNLAQRGFGTLTLVVSAAVVATAGVVLLSTVRMERSSVYTDKVYAAELIQQGKDLSSAFRMMVLRGAAANDITYGLNGPVALFNQSVSGLPLAPIPSQVFDTSRVKSPMWIYRHRSGTFQGRSPEVYWFVLGELTDGVCDQVNWALNNGKPSSLTNIGASEVSGSGATVIPPLSTFTGSVNLVGWSTGSTMSPEMGCIKLSTGANYMFSIAM